MSWRTHTYDFQRPKFIDLSGNYITLRAAATNGYTFVVVGEKRVTDPDTGYKTDYGIILTLE
jgi:hypothetical protein